MNKEHYSEEESENKDEGRYAFSSEMLGKEKIVKHNISIKSFQSYISNSLPVVDKTKHPFIDNRAASEAAAGPGLLEQNTERRKDANAPGGYGG